MKIKNEIKFLIKTFGLIKHRELYQLSVYYLSLIDFRSMNVYNIIDLKASFVIYSLFFWAFLLLLLLFMVQW